MSRSGPKFSYTDYLLLAILVFFILFQWFDLMTTLIPSFADYFLLGFFLSVLNPDTLPTILLSSFLGGLVTLVIFISAAVDNCYYENCLYIDCMSSAENLAFAVSLGDFI